jgi:hypothetical protein
MDRRNLIVSILILFFATSAVAQQPHKMKTRSPSSDGCPTSDKLESPFTYDELRQFIQNNHFESIDAVLPCLPAEFRSHFALVYDSRSSQGATTLLPRVILFDPRGKLILSYAGSDSSPGAASTQGLANPPAGSPTSPLAGSDEFEIIETSPETSEYHFRKITFPRTPGVAQANFDASPVDCKSCHGSTSSSSHPNWDIYNFWPGVYFSEADQINPGTQESKAFDAFVTSIRQSPGRYGALLVHANLPVQARSDQDAQTYVSFSEQPTLSSQGPSDLDSLIQTTNQERIAYEIRKAKKYSGYKIAILAALIDCKGIDAFLPDSENEMIRTKTGLFAAGFVKAAVDANREYANGLVTRDGNRNLMQGTPNLLGPDTSSAWWTPQGTPGILRGFDLSSDESSAYRLGQLEYLMAAQDFAIDDWFPSKDHRRILDYKSYGERLIAGMIFKDVSVDSDLAPYVKFRDDGSFSPLSGKDLENACSLLR